MKIRLTENQVSALECRHPDGWDDPELVARFWGGGQHVVVPTEASEVERLCTELNDASNAEDDSAEYKLVEDTAAARRAAKGLAAVVGKLRKKART